MTYIHFLFHIHVECLSLLFLHRYIRAITCLLLHMFVTYLPFSSFLPFPIPFHHRIFFIFSLSSYFIYHLLKTLHFCSGLLGWLLIIICSPSFICQRIHIYCHMIYIYIYFSICFSMPVGCCLSYAFHALPVCCCPLFVVSCFLVFPTEEYCCFSHFC